MSSWPLELGRSELESRPILSVLYTGKVQTTKPVFLIYKNGRVMTYSKRSYLFNPNFIILCMYVQVLLAARGLVTPGAGLPGGCERPDVDAGN